MDPLADYLISLQSIWRPLNEAETIVANGWLLEAYRQLRDDVPDVDGLNVDQRIAAGTLSDDTVKSVIVRMVKRVMQNPDGAKQRSQSIDDYQESVTYDSASPGEMHITAKEMARLLGKRLGGHSGSTAFMVTTGPGPLFS